MPLTLCLVAAHNVLIILQLLAEKNIDDLSIVWSLKRIKLKDLNNHNCKLSKTSQLLHRQDLLATSLYTGFYYLFTRPCFTIILFTWPCSVGLFYPLSQAKGDPVWSYGWYQDGRWAAEDPKRILPGVVPRRLGQCIWLQGVLLFVGIRIQWSLSYSRFSTLEFT